jgi:integrase
LRRWSAGCPIWYDRRQHGYHRATQQAVPADLLLPGPTLLRQPQDAHEADFIASSAERTLSLIEQGVLDVPDGADLVSFVSGGKKAEKPKPPPLRSLGELKQRYLDAHSLGAMEGNSFDTIRTHLQHFAQTVGEGFAIQALALEHLQQHVERRAKQTGFFGLPLSAVTLREVKQLWDCLFLGTQQVDEFLAFVRAAARHPFLPAMFVFAAHTGARRSELLRARVGDIDFEGGAVVTHEKKRVQGKRTHRRVPLSPLLEQVLRDWLTRHPGGQALFCHQLQVPRSKTRRTAGVPLTRNEANDHFKRTVVRSKWKVLRGWHVLRHSFVSNCAAKGVDQRMIDEWVGHQTEEMRKRYRHLFPDQQRQAIRSVFGEGQ